MYDKTLSEVRGLLTKDAAIHYLGMTAPVIERDDLFPEMLDGLLGAVDEETFKSFVMLYLLDMKYPRPDIAAACSVCKREKGWDC